MTSPPPQPSRNLLRENSGHVTGSWGKAGLPWQLVAGLNLGLNIWSNPDILHLL